MNYTCVSKSEGWWSYTVCPGGKIYQYHSSKGKSDYSEYILGEYSLNKNIEMNEKVYFYLFIIFLRMKVLLKVIIQKQKIHLKLLIIKKSMKMEQNVI